MSSTKPRVRLQDGVMVPAGMTGDSLQNLVAALGTSRDKRTHNQFIWDLVNHVELEAAYGSNWIATQIVNVPVDDGVREWRAFQLEEAAAIEAEEKRVNLKARFKEGRYWARLYGGGGILMITDQPLDQPLDVKKIKKGSLKRLVTLDRWDLSPVDMNYLDPSSDSYLKPEHYRVVGGTQLIHHSHLARCDGELLPRRLRVFNQSWGDSKLRRVLEDVKDVAATKGGIASLILEANVDVIRRPGLSDELASGEEANLLKRFTLAAQMKSLVNTLLLDGDEEFLRHSLTFSGLSQILEQFMVWISGAADIPMTRLFGRSAAGLSATGEGDMKNYYDQVRSEQESTFREELEPIDQVLVRSALGDYPDDLSYEWLPLAQESGVELAQQDLARAQADQLRLDQKVVKKSQIMASLKADGRYSISDDDIDRQQKLEQEEENGFDQDPDGIDPFATAGGDEPGVAGEEEEAGATPENA